MKKFAVAFLALVFAMNLLPHNLFAAEEEEEYSYGTVTSISGDQLVVSEYDFETDKDVDVTYTVDAKAEFENISKLADVKAGDSIEIDYVVRDSKKVATFVAVDKGDTAALGTDEAAAPAAAPAEPAAAAPAAPEAAKDTKAAQ